MTTLQGLADIHLIHATIITTIGDKEHDPIKLSDPPDYNDCKARETAPATALLPLFFPPAP